MVPPDEDSPAGPHPSAASATPEDTRAVEERTYLLVRCGACGEDISRVCFVFVLPTAPRPMPVVVCPLRCPECNHPLARRETAPTVLLPFPVS